MSSSNNASLFLVFFSLLLLLILGSSDLTGEGYCKRNCGGVHIPYPFGIERGCYMEKWYAIKCVYNSTSRKSTPFLSSIGNEVVNITLPGTFNSSWGQLGSIYIKNNVTSKGCSSKGEELGSLLNLTGSPFYITTRNTLVGVGGNITASLANVEAYTPTKDYLEVATCYQPNSNSTCREANVRDKYCNGIGFCQAHVLGGLQQIVRVNIDITTGGCNVAFLTNFGNTLSNQSDPKKIHAKGYATVELSWFFHTTNPSFAKSSGCLNTENLRHLTYADTYVRNCVCDYNSYLSYAKCSCTPGYEGNPYIRGGCTYIDECLDPDRGYDCFNTIPSTNQNHRPLVIGLGSSLSSLIFVGGVYFLYRFVRKQRRLHQKKKFFKRNGGMLLQQQLISTKDNVDKTKVFSSKELEKATENFSLNRILGQGGQGTVYKGMLVDGKIVAVKKSKVVDEDKLEEFINEVVILSQINHRNIVKLLGCCLETNVPMLVYEFIPNGNLFEHLHDESDDYTMATWEIRLRIAVDIAGALSYLHSSASSPIYHRDVKSTNIMLDEKYRAKISDFGTSRSVTVDHTHLTTVVSGTVGYVDPEYFQSSQFTDKSDVYSFGVVLAELITGEKSISFLRPQENRTLTTYFIHVMKENRLFDIVDARIKDGCNMNQVTAVAKLARKCMNLKGRKRPTMREVSMELEMIRSSSGDLQPLEDDSEKEDEDFADVNIGIQSWNDEVFTAPASQYIVSSSSDVEPLFPLQTC